MLKNTMWCLAAAWLVAVPVAGQVNLPRVICEETVVDFGPPPIPAGCMTRPCPDPPPPWVDWRLDVTTGPLEEVYLDFAGLPKGGAAAIEIEGKARWIGATTLALGNGTAVLRNVPTHGEGGTVSGRFDPHFPDKATARRLPRKAAGSTVGLAVEQSYGPDTVGWTKLTYTIVECPRPQLPPQGGPDTVLINSNDGGDPAVVLADGQPAIAPSGVCVDDLVAIDPVQASVGNLVRATRCNEETFVFSQADALGIAEHPGWSNNPGDVRPVLLFPPLSPWLKVWRVAGPTPAAIRVQLARAGQLLDDSRCGIDPGSPSPTDASWHTEVADAGCDRAAELRARVGFAEGRPGDTLNVYYVGDSGGAPTGWCGDATIVLDATAGPDDLAAALGRAFGLGPANPIDLDGDGQPDLATTNLLWEGSAVHTGLTEGQCLRANLAPGSFLNTSGLRANLPNRQPLLVRACPDDYTDPLCPPITFDR